MIRALLSIFMLLALSGCTNNPSVLKVLYGQFDNLMASEILDYAEFSDEQEQSIRQAVEQTVEWHRYQALPGYVDLLAEAQTRLIDQQPLASDIDWLFDSAFELGREFESKSPLLAIRPTIVALDDAQIAQIRIKIDQAFAEEEIEMLKNADKDPAEISAKNFSKFFKRIGLKLTQEQQKMAESYFGQRQISEQDRMPVWRNWTDQLIKILENRRDDTFSANFETHYKDRLTLIERTFSASWKHDQQLSKSMLLDLFTSLSDEQKQAMRERWASLSTVATDLATR